MHKVERNMPPAGLKQKSEKFKKELKKNISINKDWNNFRKSKIGQQTEENLREMYADCCAYCEGIIGTTSYNQIEHFRPKSKFPELCYEYNNLHLACQICNSNKADRFSEDFIDPSVDEPTEHIKYSGWKAVGKDKIGEKMIDAVKLNSDTRMNYRKKSCNEYKNRILVILEGIKDIDVLSNEIKDIILSSLQDIYDAMEHGSQYCTMVKDNFKEDLDLIKEILIS